MAITLKVVNPQLGRYGFLIRNAKGFCVGGSPDIFSSFLLEMAG